MTDSYSARLAGAQGIYNAGIERVKNESKPEGQKFPVGSRVRIADKLMQGMQHFPCGVCATVEYTYAHAYGGGDIKNYSLIVDGLGSVAWYKENQLTLIIDRNMNNCKYCHKPTTFYPLCCSCEMATEIVTVPSVRQFLFCLFTAAGRPDAAALMPTGCAQLEEACDRRTFISDDIVMHSLDWPGGFMFWYNAFRSVHAMDRAAGMHAFYMLHTMRPAQITPANIVQGFSYV